MPSTSSGNNKTLLITPDFAPMTGGVARYLSDLADYFGDEIFVITNNVDESRVPTRGTPTFDSTARFPVERESLFFKYVWPKWMKSVWILLSRRFDYDRVLVSHVIPFGTVAYISSIFTQKPYFVIVHGMDFRLAIRNKWKSQIAKLVLKNAEKVITNSRALSHEVKERFGLTNVEVVYPSVKGLSSGSFDRLKMTQDSLTQDKVRLLTVSRLVERKGHDRVLEAISKLSHLNVEYHIVGDGIQKSELENQTKALGLENVIFHGFVEDEKLHEIYSESDVFLMPVKEDPFDKEGFGMVFLEAALHGVPSITSKISGVDEAVLHNQTGILIESDHDLEKAIEKLVTDLKFRKSLGELAKKRVGSDFSREAQMSKLRSILYE